MPSSTSLTRVLPAQLPVRRAYRGDSFSHFFGRPLIALLGLRERRLPVDESFSERVYIPQLYLCWPVMVDRSGDGGAPNLYEKIQWAPELWWAVHAKTCPNAELSCSALAPIQASAQWNRCDHTKSVNCGPSRLGGAGSPHTLILDFLVGSRFLQHTKTIKSPITLRGS